MSRIYIPTRGRAGDVSTLDCLPGEMIKYTTLVVRGDEQLKYKNAYKGVNVLVLPNGIEGIHLTRQWILNHATEKRYRTCVMYDDDITSFGYKPDPNGWQIVPCTKTQISAMHNMLAKWVKSGQVAMAGSSDRLAAGRGRGEYQDNTRIAQVMYLNTKLAAKHWWRYDRVVVMGDMDMCMQVVASGYTVRKSIRYTHNLRPENYPGGCSIYRKDKHRIEAYEFLKQRFGDAIHVNGMRHRINWKKLAGQHE